MSSVAPTVAPRLVLADLVPGERVRDAALVLGGALLTAALAQVAIHIPGSPVPMTGQTFAVGLVGATLGFRRGLLSMVLYVVMGFFLPVYTEGGHGFSHLTGASGGYIVGFVFATALVGWLAERGLDRKVAAAFAAFVGGQILVYAFGLPVLKSVTGQDWSWTIHNGFSIYIVGELIKAVALALVLPGAWAAVRKFEG